MLFELFTGEVPFRADTPVATLLRHLEAEPPLERVPEAVRPVVARALAKDPAARWADGEAMRTALRAAREPLLAAPAAKRGEGRRALLLTLAALAVVTGAVAVVWQITPRAIPAVVATPAPAFTPPPSEALPVSPTTTAPRVTPPPPATSPASASARAPKTITAPPPTAAPATSPTQSPSPSRAPPRRPRPRGTGRSSSWSAPGPT